MNLRKKILKKIIAGLLLIFSLTFQILPIQDNLILAATFDDINQSAVFQKQAKGSVTCTLVSASMLVRRAAMMAGNSSWNSINESVMESTAWINGAGLRNSFTYAGITVNSGYYNGNTTTLINLLSAHPEGIVIYNAGMPHAILITDYTNGTFYCADPSPYYPSGRIPVAQASFQPHSGNKYWYVSSPDVNLSVVDTAPPIISNVSITDVTKDGYTVNCTVNDNVGVASVKFPSWNSDLAGQNPTWLEGTISGNMASCRVNISSLQSGAVVGNYMTHIYAFDTTGNSSSVGTAGVFVDRTQPVISSVKVLEVDSQGYYLECVVSDNHTVNKVQCPTWTEQNGQDDLVSDWGSNPIATASKVGDAYRFRLNISDHNNEYGIYTTHIYAFDNCDNFSSVGISVNVAKEMMPASITEFDHAIISVFEETLSWEDMNIFASAMNSNLISITSNEKNEKLKTILQNHYRTQYYIGGYRWSKQDSWKWIDGSRFSYENWDNGEPNCSNDNEFYAAVIRDGDRTGLWNDLSSYQKGAGFIIETPLNIEGDGILETEDKIYKFYNAELPYTVAKLFCEKKGGSLVCIGSEEENQLIAQKVGELNHSYYIGANDLGKEGVFEWVNGEAFSYSNWSDGEPNNYNTVNTGGENYVEIYPTGKWNDVSGQKQGVGFIGEFSKMHEPSNYKRGDVNADGKVDLLDVQLVLKTALNISLSSEINMEAADIDGITGISLSDAQKILRTVLKL